VGDISILIVEDDFIVAKVIEKSLRELGYSIAGMVGTGNDAVDVAGREQPDLVLMDINLQGEMDGIMAADAIRSNQDVPVVFLTAFSDQKTFSRALETAPYGYIIKPFQTNTLATTIQVALKKHRMEEEKESRNRWLEATLRSFSSAVITVDENGNIIIINPVAERLTGWPAKEATGRSLGQVLVFQDPLSGRKGTAAVRPVIAEGIVSTVPEGATVFSKTGAKTLVTEGIVSPVRNDAGAIAGAAIVLYPKTGQETAGKPDDARAAGPSPAPVAAAAEKPLLKKRRRPVTANDWIDRGNSLLFLRRYTDAVDAYERAVAISPTNYQAWYGKGTALSKTGDLSGALHAYDQALSIYPRNSQILMAKGVLLKKTGDESGANHCFELANLYTP
jgi:PAS domain S-box-containing protein